MNETSKEECLPCNESCNSCNGPSDILGNGGCNECISAIVDNDSDYSIKRCIRPEKYNCTLITDSNNKIEYYYWTTVPRNLTSHPLRGELVCRKCHSECKGCFTDGSSLNDNCKECRNNYSESTNKCVGECSKTNEYFDKGRNVREFIKYLVIKSLNFISSHLKMCLECHSKCKRSELSKTCRGGEIYDCNEGCAEFKFKLNLSDVINITEIKANEYNISIKESKSENKIHSQIKLVNQMMRKYSGKLKNESLYEIIDSYLDYLLMKKFNLKNDTKDEDVFFCVENCPKHVHYYPKKGFCSKEM